MERHAITAEIDPSRDLFAEEKNLLRVLESNAAYKKLSIRWKRSFDKAPGRGEKLKARRN